jgi:hypothetical protein
MKHPANADLHAFCTTCAWFLLVMQTIDRRGEIKSDRKMERSHMAYLDSQPEHRNSLLLLGCLWPMATLAFELATGLSAEIYGDPVPDALRLVMVMLVPATSAFLLWQQSPLALGAVMSGLAGMALGVAAIYTLLYLPVLPLALPGVLFGIGLFAFAPLASLIALWLFLASARKDGAISQHWLWAGVAASVMLLLLADMPAAMARIAIDRQQHGDSAGAMRLVRMGASQEMITNVAHGLPAEFAGVPGVLAAWASPNSRWDMALPARELLFLTTGEGVETRPARAARGLFGRLNRQSTFDRDRGSAHVGTVVDRLSLAQSWLDVRALPRANAVYAEWTAEIANASNQQQEARLTLALPEGAVASRATLWVNGAPRDASVAARGEARAAYENVVRQSRDPLLVTTDGAGRLLVQAFPVMPGQRLKFRIGATAPLLIGSDGSRSVGLPAIVSQNFAISPTLHHTIRIENAQDVSGLNVQRQQGRAGPVLAGRIVDAQLRRRTARVMVPALDGPVHASGTLGAIRVRQQIVRTRGANPGPLILLVDASRTNRAAAMVLAQSLEAIAAGFPVGLTVAGDRVQQIAVAPWSPRQRARFRQLLAALPFDGGHDNVPALLASMEAETLLWVHGVQPLRFANSTSQLEAALERARVKPPQLVRFQHVAGPAYGLVGQRWLDTARDVAPLATPALGLDQLLRALTGADPQWQIMRERLATAGTATDVPGGDHIVRLWAADVAGTSRGKARAHAGKQAAALGLVASDTGAVVLETDAETQGNGLPPVPLNVPAVPEPGTWMMMISGFYLVGWQLRRRRPALTGTAAR